MVSRSGLFDNGGIDPSRLAKKRVEMSEDMHDKMIDKTAARPTKDMAVSVANTHHKRVYAQEYNSPNAEPKHDIQAQTSFSFQDERQAELDEDYNKG